MPMKIRHSATICAASLSSGGVTNVAMIIRKVPATEVTLGSIPCAVPFGGRRPTVRKACRAAAAAMVSRRLGTEKVTMTVSGQATWLQVIEIIILADLGVYASGDDQLPPIEIGRCGKFVP